MRVGILTASDTRTPATDESGKVVQALVETLPGATVVGTYVSADNLECLQAELIRMADDLQCQLILTTGGTGVAPRDVTPEATMAVCDRLVPGLGEAMRAASLAKTPMAMISRATAGLRGACLIVNLPGSPKGARECLEAVMPALGHAVELARGDRPH
ncbi:MAG: mog [Cyanobacteria bacterium RYN_339]|nr:mog [Cyanobacteria bacterium RYN_339]